MADLDREPIREGGARVVYRHRLPTRIWHWLNAAVILVMLMTGLMIFNAHPRLYWGQYGANPDYSWLQIGDRGEQGYLRVGDQTIGTTGFLGVSGGPGDQAMYTAFPSWLTIPSDYDLALARHRHLQSYGDAILVIGCGLLPATGLGQGAQVLGGIGHHHGLPGPFQHVNIIPVIADGHGLLAIDSEARRQSF